MKIRIADWHNLHDGFELEIQPGFTALVGPNGAGKTTMLRQIKAFAQEKSTNSWAILECSQHLLSPRKAKTYQ